MEPRGPQYGELSVNSTKNSPALQGPCLRQCHRRVWLDFQTWLGGHLIHLKRKEFPDLRLLWFFFVFIADHKCTLC